MTIAFWNCEFWIGCRCQNQAKHLKSYFTETFTTKTQSFWLGCSVSAGPLKGAWIYTICWKGSIILRRASSTRLKFINGLVSSACPGWFCYDLVFICLYFFIFEPCVSDVCVVVTSISKCSFPSVSICAGRFSIPCVSKTLENELNQPSKDPCQPEKVPDTHTHSHTHTGTPLVQWVRSDLDL